MSLLTPSNTHQGTYTVSSIVSIVVVRSPDKKNYGSKNFFPVLTGATNSLLVNLLLLTPVKQFVHLNLKYAANKSILRYEKTRMVFPLVMFKINFTNWSSDRAKTVTKTTAIFDTSMNWKKNSNMISHRGNKTRVLIQCAQFFLRSKRIYLLF